jgi:Flp pilus assembly protein TadG
MNQHRPSKNGQGLLEFAITISVFLLIVIFLLDFGRYVYYSSAIHNAAREAARAAVGLSNPTDTTTLTQVAENLAPNVDITVVATLVNYLDYISDSTLQTQVARRYTGATGGLAYMPGVNVRIIGSYAPATPLITPFLGGSGMITITSEATMPLETAY